MERWKVPTERTETKHGWHDGISEKQHRPRDLDLKILMPSLFSWKRIVLAWHLYIVLMVQSRTNDNAWDRNLIRKIWRRRRRRRNAALDQQGEQITASHFKGSKLELKKNPIFSYICHCRPLRPQQVSFCHTWAADRQDLMKRVGNKAACQHFKKIL